MKKMNTRWHQSHKMPKNPTVAQRVRWHRGHLKYCACRTDVPASLKKYLEK